MKPSDWVKKVLERHGLTVSDGRPLYQYRVTDEEFNELTKLIQTSSLSGFENASRRLLMWDAVMVMYAAEWWRRHYSGKWGWEGIFRSVGFRSIDISTEFRNRLIEVGLQRWKRNVRSIGGRRQFLGTVATEGGLPLRQLSERGGWLKLLLSPVVKKHVNRGLDVHVLIEAYQDYIPNSFRSIEIKQILEDIVHTVVEIRQNYQLEDKNNPIEWLDGHVCNWRESFPLPIDEDAGRSLLNDLIDVASKESSVREESFDSLFQLERFIKIFQDDLTFAGRLDLPSSIPVDLLPHLEWDTLPGRIELELLADDGNTWSWCKGIRTIVKGVDSYKLNGRSFEVASKHVLNGFTVRAKALGETIFELPVMFGWQLEIDSPWLFKLTENRYEYFGSDSQSINECEAIVYLPEGFSYERTSETTSFDFSSPFLEGKLFLLKGKVLCRNGSEKYTFETDSEDSLVTYDLSGQRHDGFSTPSMLFIGIPDVIQRNKIAGIRKRLSSGRAVVKQIGGEGVWTPIGEAREGVQEVRIVEDGIVKWRRRIGILNDRFNVRLKPDSLSPLRGSLSLDFCQDHQVSIEVPDCDINVCKEANAAVVNLRAHNSVPSNVLANISPSGSNREIKIAVPFPSSGALLYDPDGKNLKTRTPLYLNELYGYRVTVFDERFHSGKTAILRFSLVDREIPQADVRDIYIEKKIKLAGPVTQLALNDWHSVLESILGVGGLDSSVQATLSLNGLEKFKISFFRYETELEGLWEAGQVTLDENSLRDLDVEAVQKVKLKALRLSQPEQADVALDPLFSQGIATGTWDFAPRSRDVGNWLIYPADDSSIKFRPVLWLNNDSSMEAHEFFERIHSLPKAVAVSDKSKREQAIRLVLNLMAEDVDHKSWDYLINLHEKTKHLPLATFDIWRCAVNEPKFLALLFVKTGFEDVVRRLEEELPIIWELVRVSDWLKALNNYKTSLVDSMADDTGSLDEASLEAITQILSRKINGVNNLSSSMDCISKILRFVVLRQEDRELELMSFPAEVLFSGQIEEELQNLLRRQADSAWPVMLSGQIKNIFSGLPATLKPLIDVPHEFQMPVAFLPLILAWRINTEDEYGWLGSAVNIFKIVQLKEFDEDWFNAIFNFSSGWISQHSKEFTKE